MGSISGSSSITVNTNKNWRDEVIKTVQPFSDFASSVPVIMCGYSVGSYVLVDITNERGVMNYLRLQAVLDVTATIEVDGNIIFNAVPGRVAGSNPTATASLLFADENNDDRYVKAIHFENSFKVTFNVNADLTAVGVLADSVFAQIAYKLFK